MFLHTDLNFKLLVFPLLSSRECMSLLKDPARVVKVIEPPLKLQVEVEGRDFIFLFRQSIRGENWRVMCFFL